MIQRKNNHIIRRTTLNLQLDEQRGSYEYQSAASSLFRDQIMPSIESILTKYAGKNEVLAIDKLELDLGEIRFDEPNEVVRKFNEQLELQLTRMLHQGGAQQLKYEELVFNMFMDFLHKGYLTWNSGFKNFADLLSELLSFKWRKEWREKLVKSFSEADVRSRMLHQLKSGDQLKILQKLFFETELASSIYFKKIAAQFHQKSFSEKHEVIAVCAKAFHLGYFPVDEKAANEIGQKILKSEIQKVAKKRKGPAVGKDEDSTSERELFLLVEHAGIVLINPFMKPLFEDIQLMKGKNFKSEDDQIKAVFVLNYVGTGSVELVEEQSTLFKVLCGLKFETPLPTSFDLSEEEMEKCEQVLSSVVAHWTALKNTSNDGVRATFIDRGGNLTETDSGYELKVEQSGADVLFTYSPPPWTIGMIFLPWMKKRLTVTWAS